MANTFVVAAYDVAMRWGGPEEGGWWYDAGSLVRTLRTFRNEERAYAFCRRLNGKLASRAYGPNQGKREYSSVLADGEIQACVYENAAPMGFPERRPRYE